MSNCSLLPRILTLLFLAFTCSTALAREAAWLGLFGENARTSNGRGCVRVTEVEEEGPADRAGVRVGDLLLSINEQQIEDRYDMASLIVGLRPGQEASIVLLTDGRFRTLEVRVGDRVTRSIPEPEQPEETAGEPADLGEAARAVGPTESASKSATRAVSEPAAVGVNIKPMFLSVVREYMAAAGGGGLSGEFFSTGDPDRVIPKVEAYLVGVAVDPAYLSNFKMKQYVGWSPSQEQGLCQPKHQWWTSAVTPQESRYNGWVILATGPSVDPMTAFHEAVHAYHLAIGSDADDDAYNGPEYISNNYYNIVMTLRKMIDPRVERLSKKAARGEDIAAETDELFRLISVLRSQTSDWTPQFRECLTNVGGRMDWEGYESAVRARLEKQLTPGAFQAGDGPLFCKRLTEESVRTQQLYAMPDFLETLRLDMNAQPTLLFVKQEIDPRETYAMFGKQFTGYRYGQAQTEERWPELLYKLGYHTERDIDSVRKGVVVVFRYRDEFTGAIEVRGSSGFFHIDKLRPEGVPAPRRPKLHVSTASLEAVAMRYLPRALELIDLRFPKEPGLD